MGREGSRAVGVRMFVTGLKLCFAVTLSMIMLVCKTQAGGFELQTQSTHMLGMSNAGNGVGNTISSMFWNPAATAAASSGITTDTSVIFNFVDQEISGDVSGGVAAALAGTDSSIEQGENAVSSAAYITWRGTIDPDLVLGLSVTSPFGFKSDVDNDNWVGQLHSQSAELISLNVTPSFSYDIAPGITIGAGMQFQHLDIKDLTTSLAPLSTLAVIPGADKAVMEADGYGYGFTAGITLQPTKRAKIGVGFRSSIQHKLRGSIEVPGLGGAPTTVSTIDAKIDLPEKVTGSLQYEFSPAFRGYGTVEWTNWSRLDTVSVKNQQLFLSSPAGNTVATLDLNWDDGWFFALGGEYDISKKLTLRGGIAYEISPVQDPSQRLLQIADSDRFIIGTGATYNMTSATSLNFSYNHIFFKDGNVDRDPLVALAPINTTNFKGSTDTSVDIFSVGWKTQW